MARDFFLQTTSLVPPRGVRVEMTEIRPLRPNQAVILPGVAVFGQGMKFEVKERTKYRSRSGFSQSDGIAQFSANFNRRQKTNFRQQNYLSSSSYSYFSRPEEPFRPPSYEPYRPQQPRTIVAYSDDESYLNTSSHSSTVHFPDLKVTKKSNMTPPIKKPIVPILRTPPFIPDGSNFQSQNKNKKQQKFPWERETKMPKYQNLIFTTSDNDFLKQNNSPRFNSHHALCTNQGMNRATSTHGVNNTYDFLFDRHLRTLTSIETDDDELLYNEAEVQALRSIREPLIGVDPNAQHDEEEDLESMDESEELSMIGEDLVNRSLAEVTALLDQQISLNKASSASNGRSKSAKRISFLVPTEIPRVSISSAASAEEGSQIFDHE